MLIKTHEYYNGTIVLQVYVEKLNTTQLQSKDFLDIVYILTYFFDYVSMMFFYKLIDSHSVHFRFALNKDFKPKII